MNLLPPKLQVGNDMSILSLHLAVLSAGLVMWATPVLAQEQSAAVDIVAAQVRSQGFACTNPVSAEKVEAESMPDQAVYILVCEGVKYHVRLIPDEAADISIIE